MKRFFPPVMIIIMTLVLSTISCTYLSQQKQAIRVMSFNIRYNNPDDGPNAWPNRKDVVANLILYHQADIVGMQEALADQIQDLESRLPDYKWFGVGRDDGKSAGEFSAIFYRANRFEVLEHNTFWLSETPTVAGSRGWDAACVRIVTWGTFRDRVNNNTFTLLNTHFDHRGPRARRESAKLLRSFAEKLPANIPVIITGDFNAADTSIVYTEITSASAASSAHLLVDTRSVTKQPPYGPNWSFHGFGTATRRQRIDYIFTDQHASVLQYAIIPDHWDDIWPSDHLPVIASIVYE